MPKPEENKPLEGVNIIITRAFKQSGDELDVLINNGAEIIFFPAIETKLCKDAVETFGKDISPGDYNYIVFSSVNAVNFFTDVLEMLHVPFPAGIKIVAVGEKTAEKLENLNLHVDIIPETFTAEGLLEIIQKEKITGKKVLLPQSAIARPVLREGLQALGADVTSVELYETVAPDEYTFRDAQQKLKKITSGVFVFTSPSTFNNFLKIENIKNAPEYFCNYKVAVIGSITREAVEKSGVTVDIMPEKFTMKYLADEILKYYSN